MKKSINERIHDLRERSGLTQSDLAIQLGMTRSGVNAWEMGISKPSLENLVILSRILHTTTDYLLGNNNEETIVINDFTPEEKEMVMRMVHYIEEVHQLKCKKKQPSRQIGGLFRSSIRNLFSPYQSYKEYLQAHLPKF